MKEIKHNNAIVALESAKNLAIEELRELNSNNLKSFSKSEQKLQMKINMQLFLWKVVEATKLDQLQLQFIRFFIECAKTSFDAHQHLYYCERKEKKYVFTL